MNNEYLMHHGVLGMKWGVRRYQNPDGSLTEAGKKRYKKTVFVSGSSKTQDPESGYYRKKLPKAIRKELDEYMSGKSKIVVGDAPGIDRQVQDYLNKRGYENVEVYGPGKQVRYNANEHWKTNPIDVPTAEVGSKEWLAAKDVVMSNVSDVGLAVILDSGAKATRKNVERMIDAGKDVSVYELNTFNKKNDKFIDAKEMVAKDKQKREAEEQNRKNVQELKSSKTIQNTEYIDGNYKKYRDDATFRKKYDAAAELGLKALNNTRGEEFDPKDKGWREWFLFEDQTIGLPTVAYMINQGVPAKEVKDLVRKAQQSSYYDVEDNEKLRTFVFESEYIPEDFIDECEKIKKAPK